MPPVLLFEGRPTFDLIVLIILHFGQKSYKMSYFFTILSFFPFFYFKFTVICFLCNQHPLYCLCSLSKEIVYLSNGYSRQFSPLLEERLCNEYYQLLLSNNFQLKLHSFGITLITSNNFITQNLVFTIDIYGINQKKLLLVIGVVWCCIMSNYSYTVSDLIRGELKGLANLKYFTCQF